MWRKPLALAVLVATTGAACTDDRTETKVEGLKVTQPSVPQITAPVEVPAPGIVTPAPPAATATPAAPPSSVAVSRPPRPRAAAYDLAVACTSSVKRRSGTQTSGAPAVRSIEVAAGARTSYSMVFERNRQPEDPVVEQNDRCTIATKRVRDGAEPRLAILLGCTGEATYSANPQEPSAVAESWRQPADLLDGYTHSMKTPKTPDHLSERVDCTIEIRPR